MNARIRWPDQRTIDYVSRRNPSGEFKADLDTIRRLKGYVARELFPIIIDSLTQAPQNMPAAA